MIIRDNVLVKVDDTDIENGSYTIPEGVTSIGTGAFNGSNRLTNITIPEGVISIGNGAFNECSWLRSIELPEGLTSIGFDTFNGCISLTNITIPKSVISIGNGAFRECTGLRSIELPEGLTSIGIETFERCISLTNIAIPESVTSIGNRAFKGCIELRSIELPEGLTSIGIETFDSCMSLTNITIPESVISIGNGAFRECIELRSIELPESLTSIGDGAFHGCSGLTNITIPESVTSIGGWAFEGCNSLTSIIIPKSVEIIFKEAFKECSSLTSIAIPDSVRTIGDGAFVGCGNLCEINVSKQDKNEDEYDDYKLISIDGVLYGVEISTNYKELMMFPEGKREEYYIIPKDTIGIRSNAFAKCNGLKKIIIPDDLSIVGLGEDFFDYNNVVYDKDKKSTMLEKNAKVSKFIPIPYLELLFEENRVKSFLENADFRHFNSNVPDLKGLLEGYSSEEQMDFFKFVVCLGCFSKKKMLDNNGQETEVTVGQKASALLAQLIKTSYLQIGQYHGLFDSMSFNAEVVQEFLKFITPQGKKNDNLELLINLEYECPGIFSKVMAGFEKAKGYRTTLSEDGTIKTVPWEEALKLFYNDTRYVGVTEENQDIAEVYGSKGVSQMIFEKGSELRKKAREKGVQEHILGKEMREQSILESIEDLRKQTSEELENTQTLIENLYKKQFSFEWLNKNDPRNGILGLYVSCCGSINSAYYGKKIAESSITEKNVQNLVVRDSKGEIISKGTIYVDEEHGYAVFNDFELNQKYRGHERESGVYQGDDKDESELSESEKKQREERDLIFGAFQRGIQAFVEEYDLQHPNCPMQQINVGMGYNRLKRNVMQFEEATELLTVPVEYGFEDARQGQRVLYRRKEREIHNDVSLHEL